MTAAAADYSREIESGVKNAYAMEATEIIYDGTFGGENASGYAQALAAGDPFLGVNVDGRWDNSTGAAGDVEAILTEDIKIEWPVTGIIDAADVGMRVYATDDQVLTITPGTPGGSSCVGTVARYVSSGVAIVHFKTGLDVDNIGLMSDTTIPAEDATAANVTITAASVIAGFWKRDGGAARTDTLPTATLLVAAIRAPRVGQRIFFTIQNVASGAHTITVAAGSGGSADGDSTLTIDQDYTRAFMIVLTNVTAGALAYALYSLGASTH